jgi:hypothetical protein
MSASKALPLALAALLIAACDDSGPTSGTSPKQACLDANQFQRDATALENAIRTATNADVPALNDQAAALSQEMSHEVSAGVAAGTNVNDDLVAALNAVNKVITDLSTPNLAQAKLDSDGLLRNAMITLAQDCSRYLT